MRYNVGGQPGAGRDASASCGFTTSLVERGESLPACPACPSGPNTTYRPATPGEAR